MKIQGRLEHPWDSRIPLAITDPRLQHFWLQDLCQEILRMHKGCRARLLARSLAGWLAAWLVTWLVGWLEAGKPARARQRTGVRLASVIYGLPSAIV